MCVCFTTELRAAVMCGCLSIYVCVCVCVSCVGERRRWVIAHIPPGHNSSPCCWGRGNPRGVGVLSGRTKRPDIIGCLSPTPVGAEGGNRWKQWLYLWGKLGFYFLSFFLANIYVSCSNILIISNGMSSLFYELALCMHVCGLILLGRVDMYARSCFLLYEIMSCQPSVPVCDVVTSATCDITPVHE